MSYGVGVAVWHGHGLRGWRSWRGDGSGGGIMTTTSAFMLNVRLDNVAVVAIDVHGEKVNTLKAEFAAQVRAIQTDPGKQSVAGRCFYLSQSR